MSSVDRMYVKSRKEFVELYDWCVKFKDLCKREIQIDILDCFYFTPDDEYDVDCTIESAVAYFTETIDKWLYLHCPIEFVRNRLLEQYGRTFENIRKKHIKLYINKG